MSCSLSGLVPGLHWAGLGKACKMGPYSLALLRLVQAF